MCNGMVLHILIDSGSTHNFLDLNMAKKLGCKIQNIPPQAIAVAYGNYLTCQSMSKGFSMAVSETRIYHICDAYSSRKL